MGNWPSFGNYAFYIFMSFGMTLVLMLAEPIWLMMQRKQILKNIMRLIRINDRS